MRSAESCMLRDQTPIYLWDRPWVTVVKLHHCLHQLDVTLDEQMLPNFIVR